MNNINFNNKIFTITENSNIGEADNRTVFKYSQNEDLVTGDYQGGRIRTGKIIARLDGHQLHMLYQCITVDNELKSGKATADITFTEQHKMKLNLHWEWLKASGDKGSSVYVEI